MSQKVGWAQDLSGDVWRSEKSLAGRFVRSLVTSLSAVTRLLKNIRRLEKYIRPNIKEGIFKPQFRLQYKEIMLTLW
jgi:hypothetical protein